MDLYQSNLEGESAAIASFSNNPSGIKRRVRQPVTNSRQPAIHNKLNVLFGSGSSGHSFLQGMASVLHPGKAVQFKECLPDLSCPCILRIVFHQRIPMPGSPLVVSSKQPMLGYPSYRSLRQSVAETGYQSWHSRSALPCLACSSGVHKFVPSAGAIFQVAHFCRE